MKKRWIALLMIVAVTMLASVASATPSRGNLVHFIPVSITVSGDDVTVRGYFLNLNDDCDVLNFRNFEMEVYYGGQLLVSGSFGTIHEFTVNPLSVYPQAFVFSGGNRLADGTYDCDDSFHCVFSAQFSSRQR